MTEGLFEMPALTQQERQMTRGGAAGVGHVDMRIGAIGNQRVGVIAPSQA